MKLLFFIFLICLVGIIEFCETGDVSPISEPVYDTTRVETEEIQNENPEKPRSEDRVLNNLSPCLNPTPESVVEDVVIEDEPVFECVLTESVSAGSTCSHETAHSEMIDDLKDDNALKLVMEDSFKNERFNLLAVIVRKCPKTLLTRLRQLCDTYFRRASQLFVNADLKEGDYFVNSYGINFWMATFIKFKDDVTMKKVLIKALYVLMTSPRVDSKDLHDMLTQNSYSSENRNCVALLVSNFIIDRHLENDFYYNEIYVSVLYHIQSKGGLDFPLKINNKIDFVIAVRSKIQSVADTFQNANGLDSLAKSLLFSKDYVPTLISLVNLAKGSFLKRMGGIEVLITREFFLALKYLGQKYYYNERVVHAIISTIEVIIGIEKFSLQKATAILIFLQNGFIDHYNFILSKYDYYLSKELISDPISHFIIEHADMPKKRKISFDEGKQVVSEQSNILNTISTDIPFRIFRTITMIFSIGNIEITTFAQCQLLKDDFLKNAMTVLKITRSADLFHYGLTLIWKLGVHFPAFKMMLRESQISSMLHSKFAKFPDSQELIQSFIADLTVQIEE